MARLTISDCGFFRVNELRAEAASLRTDLKIFLEEEEATGGAFADGWEGASATASEGCFWLFRVNELEQAEAASPRTRFMLFFGFIVFSEGDKA